MQKCIEENVDYTVLPGPSAVITALAGSGFPCHAFSFDGFLPVKKGKRRKAIEAAIQNGQSDGKTAMFFESPHRIQSTLEILKDIQADLFVCVARELSKKFETYHRGIANDLWEHFKDHKAKGEIVLLIDTSSYIIAPSSE